MPKKKKPAKPKGPKKQKGVAEEKDFDEIMGALVKVPPKKPRKTDQSKSDAEGTP